MGSSKPTDDDLEQRRERARARRGRVTIRRVALGADVDEPPIRGEAALSLVTQLTRVAWQLSGNPAPRHDRASMSYVFVLNPPEHA